MSGGHFNYIQDQITVDEGFGPEFVELNISRVIFTMQEGERSIVLADGNA